MLPIADFRFFVILVKSGLDHEGVGFISTNNQMPITSIDFSPHDEHLSSGPRPAKLYTDQ